MKKQMETRFDFLATPTQAVNEATNYINAIDERILALEKALEPIRNAADSLRDMLEDSYDIRGSTSAEHPDFEEQKFKLLNACFDFHIRFGIYVEQLAGPSPAPTVGGREA